MEASWHQNRSRNRCYLRKAVFREILVFPAEKHTFLRSRGSKLEAKIHQKSMSKTMRKQRGSETRFLQIFDGFGRHLGLPKRSQDAQKSMLKGHQNLISFLKASWKAIISKNLRCWRPTWKQVGTQIEAEIDVIFERPFFEKNNVFHMKNKVF